MADIFPVILSGGSGTRLWPVSTPEKPKQFHPLLGAETLFQSTLRRFQSAEHGLRWRTPLVIHGAAHRQLVQEQAHAIGADALHTIEEPVGRNTAPAVCVAALEITRNDPEAVLLIAPADHHIGNIPSFYEAISLGWETVQRGSIITFGIRPTQPETGFGYIKAGEAIDRQICSIAAFTEKPDAQTAESFIADGRYFWNAGIFMGKASTLLAAFEKHAPQILSACEESLSAATRKNQRVELEQANFVSCPSISFDYAIMEKIENGAMVMPVDLGWSDVGSWPAVHAARIAAADTNNTSPHLRINSEGCFVHSEGPTIATVGVDDLIIIASEDAVLITTEKAAQKTKLIPGLLKDKPPKAED